MPEKKKHEHYYVLHGGCCGGDIEAFCTGLSGGRWYEKCENPLIDYYEIVTVLNKLPNEFPHPAEGASE